jgi:glycosyltransferase involved in cell wall biosynthesis
LIQRKVLMRVVMLSTFGPEVRGISYYSDCLLDALVSCEGVEPVAVDYHKIYPDWLHPAGSTSVEGGENRSVHYARPWTWRLDRQRPDLIHLQAWTTVTALIHHRILTTARTSGVPTVLTLHNPAAHEKRGLSGSIQTRCLELADRIILHDECGVTALPDSCRRKVRIIPHGTELLDLAEKDLHQVAEQQPYLLYFGNIRPYKGIELLLSAWDECADEFSHCSLLVAGRLWQGKNILSRIAAQLLGTAKYSRHILSLAGKAQRKQVAFRFEFIDDDELDQLIRGARYTIFPYLKFSGHSGAVARSAANGTPVLVSDVGGLQTFAAAPDNIFAAGNKRALADMLVKKLRPLEVDFEERSRQLELARSLSWTHAADLHCELYRELCAQTG